jgi:phage terminase large subunit-like protein
MRRAASGCLAARVAAMCSQARVKHVDPRLAKLEDQMCDVGVDGFSSGRLTDHADPLVWAITELTAPKRAEPRIRAL